MSLSVPEYCSVILILLVILVTTASVQDCDAEVDAAISRSDFETVQRVLERDTNKTIIEKQGWKIACIAAEKGNLSIIEYIAGRDSSILERENENGDTIVHIAAENGYQDIVEYIVKTCRDYRSGRGHQESLFGKAAERGHLNVIQCLEKIFPHFCSYGCVSSSKLAADNGHLDVACYVATMSPIYDCSKFKDIIKTAIQKSRKRDNQTLEFILKLATKWEEEGYCPNIVQLAYQVNDTKLIHYLSENRCTHFVKTNGMNEGVQPMEIVFKKNLVNRKFLECLETNSVLHKKFGVYGNENIGYAAAKYGRLDVIQFVAQKNASILTEFSGFFCETVANIAANNKRADIVQCVLKVRPLSFVIKDWLETSGLIARYSTVFHLAMAYNYLDMNLLKYLVEEKRTPLATTDDEGETVAHIAAKNGDMEKLQYLVQKDPRLLTISDRWGNTILHTLARKDTLSEQSLKFFLDNGAPLTVLNQEGNTVGHILAKNGHPDFVKYLVEKEPSILNITDWNGDTICHILAREDLLSVRNLKFFVEKGVSLVAKSLNGDSIALIAAEKGKLRMLEYIIEKEPSLFSGDASLGAQIGNMAAERGYSNVLKSIAEKKPAFLLRRTDILFKLPNALDVLDTLRYLITICETKIPNWDRRPFESEVLSEALEHDNPEVLKYMKYNVNTVNDQGEPLIFSAIHLQRRHIFHYLITDGQANLTALDREGNNILFVAAMNGDLEKIKHILDNLRAPLDIEWRNKAGDSLLHVAVHEALEHTGRTHEDSEDVSSEERRDNQLRVIKYLIEHRRADINARGHANKTVLQVAKARGNEIISKHLLAHGADSNLGQ